MENNTACPGTEAKTIFIQEETFPELVKPAPEPERRTKHNLTRINRLLFQYGLEIDPEIKTVKIKSFWRFMFPVRAGKGDKNVEKL